MEIVRKDKNSNCRFVELKAGDVFIEKANGDEYIQMKTEETESYNAVNLKTGEMYFVDSYTEVKQVHAELIIRNIEEA